MSKVTAIIVACLLFGLIATGASAAAPDAPNLGIRPVGQEGSYFTLELPAGQRQTITVEVGNFGAQTTDAVVYPADVYTLTNGGFGARLDGAPVSGVTNWLDYAREELALTPGQAVQRTITVAVPEATPAGEYITSLVVQNATPIKGTGAFAIDQIVRQAIAVAIVVPGTPAPGLAIGDAAYAIEGGVTSVGVALSNTGNVHLKPVGTVVIRNAAAAVVLEKTLAMDSFYAGTSTRLLIGLTTPFAPGDYTLRVTLVDEPMQLVVQTKDLPFTVAPVGAETLQVRITTTRS